MPSSPACARARSSLAGVLACAGCSAAIPSAPTAVGDGFPGTCLPAEVSWPSDFLESLPGESEAIGGRIVGLRLEWVDGDFVWRLRSADTRHDMFGEPVDDPSFGKGVPGRCPHAGGHRHGRDRAHRSGAADGRQQRLQRGPALG
ncbi:hypothetical protein JM654_21025 [Microbacterium oxydans]|nr:hypothetical protein [Microbacterium oxydans]